MTRSDGSGSNDQHSSSSSSDEADRFGSAPPYLSSRRESSGYVRRSGFMREWLDIIIAVNWGMAHGGMQSDVSYSQLRQASWPPEKPRSSQLASRGTPFSQSSMGGSTTPLPQTVS